MITPDELARTMRQSSEMAAPIIIYAATIAPIALHRIAPSNIFKMNIACSRNGAFPCRIGAWERLHRARSNSGAKRS